MIYGYARVSRDGQSLDAQADALTEAGAGSVFREDASGAKTDRTQLRRVLDELAQGDVLTVTRLDRLAGSRRELSNLIMQITEKGAGFRSLGDIWADTTAAYGPVMIAALGGLAAFERERKHSRTSNRCARAKAQGIRFGRKPKLTEVQKREALARLDALESIRSVARSFSVSHSTIARLSP